MPKKHDQEINELVKLACNVTDAFTTALFLVSEKQGGQLYLKACQSLSNSIVPKAVIPVGHGLVGWVAKNECQAFAKDFTQDSQTLLFYSKDESLKSFAACPIFDGERLIGVLTMDSKQRYFFTDKKMKLLTQFAETFARTISLGKNRIRLDEDAVSLTALNEITEKAASIKELPELVKMLKLSCPAMIRHDHLVLAVRSPSDDEYRLVRSHDRAVGGDPMPLTHYRLGWVIHQRRPIYIPDLDSPVFPGDQKKWKSFIGAPMVSSDFTVGAIGLMSRKPGAFRQTGLTSLAVLASALAAPLANYYMEKKNKSAAVSDPLTNTPALQSLLSRHRNVGRIGVVGIVDLKNFRHVNRELGFRGGDAILVEMTERIKEAIGKKGFAGRMYADKFAVILPDLNRSAGGKILQKAVDAIESQPFIYNGVEAHITPSAGAAEAPEHGITTEELLIKAEKAVRRTKQSQGAQVLFFDDPETPLPGGRLQAVK